MRPNRHKRSDFQTRYRHRQAWWIPTREPNQPLFCIAILRL
ncbi:Uncharacterised protein [Vibrio cholerae]|nr:Uncharacterised protein [Vibrio cholerae]